MIVSRSSMSSRSTSTTSSRAKAPIASGPPSFQASMSARVRSTKIHYAEHKKGRPR